MRRGFLPKKTLTALVGANTSTGGAHLLDADQDVECRRVERGSPVRLDFPHRRETSLDQRIRERQHTKDVDQSGDTLVALAVVGVDLCPDARGLLPLHVGRDELLQL